MNVLDATELYTRKSQNGKFYVTYILPQFFLFFFLKINIFGDWRLAGTAFREVGRRSTGTERLHSVLEVEFGSLSVIVHVGKVTPPLYASVSSWAKRAGINPCPVSLIKGQ